MNPINVLLVEDDGITVYLIKKVLEQTQLTKKLTCKSDGKDAIDFLHEQQNNPDSLPEIILLDLNMPIMDGWEFLSQYKLVAPLLAKKPMIYICTSSISPEEVLRAETNEYVKDYIIKPLQKQVFYHLVEQFYKSTV